LFLNLVPAARRKSGEILDLPLALAAAAAAGHFEGRALKNAIFLGELGIDGSLHAVAGRSGGGDRGARRGKTRALRAARDGGGSGGDRGARRSSERARWAKVVRTY
jgi:hypothetical protein